MQSANSDLLNALLLIFLNLIRSVHRFDKLLIDIENNIDKATHRFYKVHL